LIDSGCEGSCIDRTFVETNRIPTIKLPRPIPIYNANGQPNSDGPISELAIVFLTCGTHTERIELGVTHLGREKIFLGHDWLHLHNPNIDWQTGMVGFSCCPSLCQPTLQNSCIDPDYDEEEPWHTTVLEDGDHILMVDANPAIQIRAKDTMSTELAPRAAQRIPTRTFEELVPEYLRDYWDVFQKKDFDELPPHRPWDHAIELLPNTESILNCKIYPLSSAYRANTRFKVANGFTLLLCQKEGWQT
jgi:hypothetical protein